MKVENRQMTETVAQLFAASKSLSVDEQIELFDALWNLLDPAEAADFDLTPEQQSELDRRREELRRLPDTAVTFDEGRELMAGIRAGQ